MREETPGSSSQGDPEEASLAPSDEEEPKAGGRPISWLCPCPLRISNFRFECIPLVCILGSLSSPPIPRVVTLSSFPPFHLAANKEIDLDALMNDAFAELDTKVAPPPVDAKPSKDVKPPTKLTFKNAKVGLKPLNTTLGAITSPVTPGTPGESEPWTPTTPMGASPKRKSTMNDFKLLTVLGRGSYGKVVKARRSLLSCLLNCTDAHFVLLLDKTPTWIWHAYRYNRPSNPRKYSR